MANHNTHIFVRNLPNTSLSSSRSVCGCPSWLSHWERYTGTRRTTCMAHGCPNPPEVGGHVQYADRRRTSSPLIAGLCRACNIHHNTEPFAIDQRSSLVYASPANDCG